MKRWRILSLLLAVLAAGGLLAAGLFVSAAGRNVVYDETILQGAAEDFSGVVVHAKNRIRNEVLWETDYRPGSGLKTDTTARYGVSDWAYIDLPPSVHCSSYLTNAPMIRNGDEADLMVESVASRTPVGETHEEVIRAADWYEFFPITVWMDGDGTDSVQTEAELKIPVPEDYFVRVIVSRPDSAQFSFTIREEAFRGPTLDAVSAGVTDGDAAHCWFALDTGSLDTSLLPGGGGVMQMDSADSEVKSAYSLPVGTRVVDLWLSEDESTLYVLHSLDGAHTVTALRTEDMAVRQEIALPIAAEAALEPTIRDGETVLLPATDGTLTVLTAGDDSALTLRMQVTTAGDPVLQAPAHQELRELVSADFRDGRLVLARQQYVEADVTQDLDLLISVYDETGSRSTMVSRCSVGQEIDPERDKRKFYTPRDFALRPGWTRPVTVSFEKDSTI